MFIVVVVVVVVVVFPDVDECVSGTANCLQICINTVGSYECDCQAGFSLSEDNTTCNPGTNV